MSTAPPSSPSRSVGRAASLGGVLSVPGDKSISHRSLILNAIAQGDALVQGLSGGEDVISTMHCLQAMGVDIHPEGAEGSYRIKGSGPQLVEPEDILDAGNSGTSMRLLSGILASQPFVSVITGDGSLRSRPMQRIVLPLKQMGAQIMGRQSDSLAPLTVRGGELQGIEYDLPMASAQVKSAIMLAALSARGDTVIHQPALSRDHTERMVSAMGGNVEEDGLDLTVHPTELNAVDITVPGDISSAAFWIVAGLCQRDARILVSGVGMNPSRTGIVDVLQEMGAGDGLKLVDERTEGGEPVADLQISPAELHGVEIGGDMIPRILDEVPILAVAACFASGDTVIRDAAELRVKESDRIATTVAELTRLGANIEAREDGMVIHGTGRLTGADCESHGDHRLAMSMAVAGLLAEGETTVHGAPDASVSYPEFWRDLDLLTQDAR
ncbi:MAG: 3-phosphoshikimate 1-carboxyvinyltransferase [SAR202 cluster bacterium]|nr:3-phosphoshikimate 1-carboxyvinyltransferase [Chloroflexota bacterium]MQG34340.1 3-phosphoshikimate 1-carboxyvinyltransferase [SAR202 cluster bacterium]HCP24587.1 3-phosphoshikimate 1-carboxyvinyltransferase [Dehalococcoidia bacterium]